MQLSLNIFFVLKIVRLLLKESVQLILFVSVAASGNISMFFNERVAASKKTLSKNV